MKRKKILGGLIGFFLACVPVFGSYGLIALLCVRKKYKLIFIPILCILFLILGVISNSNTSKIEKLPKSIENKIFSISFPTDEKMTIEQFSKTVQNSLSDTLSNDAKNMPEYQDLLDKCYMVYETEYIKNFSTCDSFYLPVMKKYKIQEELDSFRENYLQSHRWSINFSNFFMVLFVLSYFFSIPFSVHIFYKYLFNAKTDYSENIVRNNSSQRRINDTSSIDIEEIISVVETPTPAIIASSIPVKINYASVMEIQEELKLTAIQAKTILAERETNGNFLDFPDFIKRVGLSERRCNQFKDQLDFSLNNQSHKQSGRVLEF